MANTYTQLYTQFVFAVQNRPSLILESWQSDLYKYMNGIIKQQGHKPYAINGPSNHVHILVSMHPNQSSSDLVYNIKRSSSLWINENKLVPGKFSWQEGFGAFSYGKSQMPNIIAYIDNQKIHHMKRTFHEEYIAFLKAFDVDFDERYILKSIE